MMTSHEMSVSEDLDRIQAIVVHQVKNLESETRRWDTLGCHDGLNFEHFKHN